MIQIGIDIGNEAFIHHASVQGPMASRFAMPSTRYRILRSTYQTSHRVVAGKKGSPSHPYIVASLISRKDAFDLAAIFNHRTVPRNHCPVKYCGIRSLCRRFPVRSYIRSSPSYSCLKQPQDVLSCLARSRHSSSSPHLT